MSSFDVIRKVRHLAKTRKVGHTGTLDPDATGVLPIALGRCTKLSKYLTLDDKCYRFRMVFGAATTTDDSTGQVLRKADYAGITRGQVEAVLESWVGELLQVPPIYSAIKVDGKRAYERARAGEEVELSARKVRIDALEIVAWDLPRLELEVRCGPGTYVRSLARDLGECFDSAAHTTAIHRRRVGPFGDEQAVALKTLEESDDFWHYVLPAAHMVATLPKVVLDEEQTRRVGHGQRLVVQGSWPIGQALAAQTSAGALVAVMECEDRRESKAKIRPKRVLMPLRGGS